MMENSGVHNHAFVQGVLLTSIPPKHSLEHPPNPSHPSMLRAPRNAGFTNTLVKVGRGQSTFEMFKTNPPPQNIYMDYKGKGLNLAGCIKGLETGGGNRRRQREHFPAEPYRDSQIPNHKAHSDPAVSDGVLKFKVHKCNRVSVSQIKNSQRNLV